MRSGSLFVASLALLALLSGCLGAAEERDALDAAPSPPEATLAFAEGAVDAAAGLAWTGAELRGAKPYNTATFVTDYVFGVGAGACGSGDCERTPFSLLLGDAAANGTLEVAVTVEATDAHEAIFEAWLEDAGGTVLDGGFGFYAVLLQVAEPAAGDYAVTVRVSSGQTAYAGLARLAPALPPPAADAELLPNLVTLPIADVRLEVAKWGNLPGTEVVVPPAVLGAPANAGHRGCAPDELEPGQRQRCLRLSNAIGNVGEGPLEVHLPFGETPGAVQGSGQFMQRIFLGDGSWRDVEARDSAYLHPNHGHLHYEGIAHYQVFAYDMETGARGEEVVDGRKAGFCLADEGLVEPGRDGTGKPLYGRTCVDPTMNGESLFMGLTPGWFDGYETYRTDQFVDLGDAPDGVYELVSTANADMTLVESDYDDNEASVLFRLTGDEVEVLGPPPARSP